MITMNPVLRNFLITCGLLVLVFAAGYAYVTRQSAGTGPTSDTASTTTYTLPDGTVISVPAGATITEVTEPAPAAQGPQAPDYRKPIVYDASVSAEVRAAIEAQFAKNKEEIARDSRDFNAWMNLAILRKIAGDYRGAETIWLYATEVWPTNPVAFNNLGDLYTNFLKDPAKAKLYYDAAAKLRP